MHATATPYPRRASKIDGHLAMRLRLLRMQHGITQQELAVVLGASHAQMQRYEAGKVRFPVSLLCTAAELFCVPVSFFTDGLPHA